MNDVVVTSDGSHTLRSKAFVELYHSHHGAITESKHVFIDSGFKYIAPKGKSSISILEYGFGTGLNAALSWQLSDQFGCTVDYTTLEKYPIGQSEVDQLNYADLLSFPHFPQLHSSAWGSKISLSQYFALTKLNESFEDYQSGLSFDVIYYDAFAPSTQAHLWLNPHLQNVVNHLSPGGVLVTYCAKGSFKRALRECNLVVTSLPGPPGKREITRAQKQ